MRRVMAVAILVILFAVAAHGLSVADRALISLNSTRAPIRAYVGATVQQYDTMAVSSGERVELLNFSIYADDSAQAPTLGIWFVSKVSKTVYLRLSETYTANQFKTTSWAGPWVFPKDSTILVYYHIKVSGDTLGTLDTLRAAVTYRLERP